MRVGLQEELVLRAGEGHVAQVVLGDLRFGEQGAEAQRAGGVLGAEELVLGDGCLEAGAVVEVAGGFGEEFGDGVDAFGGVAVAGVQVVDGAIAIGDAGVLGASADAFGDGLEGVAGAFGGFPRGDLDVDPAVGGAGGLARAGGGT